MISHQLALGILAVNALAFASMWLDKQQAKRQGWRIPEANLFGLALLGGSLSILLAMKCFRHKTAKRRFYWRIAIIVWLQIIGLGAFWLFAPHA